MSELQHVKEVALQASPSILYNNLCLVGDSYAYSHQQDVYLVKPLGPHKIALSDKDRAQITSLGATTFQRRTILVITTNSDTILWDTQKEVQLAIVAHGPDDETRGCAAVDFGSQLILAMGHATGELEFASVTPEFNVQIVKRQKAHRGAITAVASNPNSVSMYVSGDTSGEIHFWNNQMQAYVSAPVPNDSVSAVEIVGNWVLAAYGSGTIRMFNGNNGQIRFDIGAHSRWITGMAFSPVNNMLATVAEDNLLCVFRLQPHETSPKAEFVGHKIHPNRLLTGVQFAPDGKTAHVSVYDSEKMHIYAIE